MIIERLELEEHPVIHLSLHPFFLGREPPSIPMFTLSLIVNSFTLVFLCVFILSTIFCALLCCFFGNDFCVFHSSTASKYDSSYFFFAFPASQLSDITCDTVCRVFLFCLFFVAAVVAVAVAVAVAVVESQTANYCCILGANFSAVSSYSVFAYRCILRSVPV